jgi:hypothetical protein
MVVVCWLGLVWTAIDQVIDTRADKGIKHVTLHSEILEFEGEQTLGYETSYCSKTNAGTFNVPVVYVFIHPNIAV